MRNQKNTLAVDQISVVNDFEHISREKRFNKHIVIKKLDLKPKTRERKLEIPKRKIGERKLEEKIGREENIEKIREQNLREKIYNVDVEEQN